MPRKPREKKFNVPTEWLRIQREVPKGHAKPIKEAVTKFIDDNAKEVKIKEKIQKLNDDLKGIKDAD